MSNSNSLKLSIIPRLTIVACGKNCMLCAADCPFWIKGSNNCKLFGKLTRAGDYLLRDDDCLSAEDAAHHFDLMSGKLK